MAISNLFSKRQKKLRGEVSDIYIYDEVPENLRVQIVHIIRDAIGEVISVYSGNKPKEAYGHIHNILCREYGVFSLGNNRDDDETSLLNYILSNEDVERVMDAVELSFEYIMVVIEKDYYAYTSNTTVKLTPTEAVDELNERFKESGIGFQFESGEMVRVDSTFIHNEVTKPTLNLLHNKKFLGANEEYLKAHEHYRHGRNKECLNECLKAFESTLKIICSEKGWIHSETDTAKKLIQICFQNELVPTFTQNQFTSLQNLIESGIPSIRNKVGGHGQGQTLKPVSDCMTRYGLNLTGSNIIFLIEQSKL